jgi:hypothetical protein
VGNFNFWTNLKSPSKLFKKSGLKYMSIPQDRMFLLNAWRQLKDYIALVLEN